MYLVISLFGFEGRIWDLIVSVPDHCLSFYFACLFFFQKAYNLKKEADKFNQKYLIKSVKTNRKFNL